MKQILIKKMKGEVDNLIALGNLNAHKLTKKAAPKQIYRGPEVMRRLVKHSV